VSTQSHISASAQPLAVAGLVLGLRARRVRRCAVSSGAVVLSGLALLQLAVCVPLYLFG
jgi:hypothetical protein